MKGGVRHIEGVTIRNEVYTISKGGRYQGQNFRTLKKV